MRYYGGMTQDWKTYLNQLEYLAYLDYEKNSEALEFLVQSIIECASSENGVVFTAGNGGSATTADHFAADLSLSKKRYGKPIRSICLNSHLGLNSALSNDLGYEFALESQLENFGGTSHIVVVFSASGNSSNLIKLINSAVSRELQCWAILGFNGGEIAKIKKIKHIIFLDKESNYGLTENIHLAASHFVIERLASEVGFSK